MSFNKQGIRKWTCGSAPDAPTSKNITTIVQTVLILSDTLPLKCKCLELHVRGQKRRNAQTNT